MINGKEKRKRYEAEEETGEKKRKELFDEFDEFYQLFKKNKDMFYLILKEYLSFRDMMAIADAYFEYVFEHMVAQKIFQWKYQQVFKSHSMFVWPILEEFPRFEFIGIFLDFVKSPEEEEQVAKSLGAYNLVKIINVIVQYFPNSFIMSYGETIYNSAFSQGHTEMVRFIINERRNFKLDALIADLNHMIAWGYQSLIEYFTSIGVNLKWSQTHLEIAIRMNRPEVVEFIFDNTEIDPMYNDGEMLFYAATLYRMEIVRLFLERKDKVDPSIRDNALLLNKAMGDIQWNDKDLALLLNDERVTDKLSIEAFQDIFFTLSGVGKLLSVKPLLRNEKMKFVTDEDLSAATKTLFFQ